MSFKDHFSSHSAQYSQYRPSYPEELFSWLSSLCEEHSCAWDCATGSGQAAIGLTDRFDKVIATDASANQISEAIEAERICYKVAPAENSGIAPNSVDLITVAQALHWFDIPAFTQEADKVLKNGGILAAWTYGLFNIDADLDNTIAHLYADIVGDYWPFERKMVEDGYAQVNLPFSEVPARPMEMLVSWTLSDLVGYLGTWSAVKAFEQDQGYSPLEKIGADLVRHWGDTGMKRSITWPLIVRVWRKSLK